MSQSSGSFWPEDIRFDLQTPLTILRPRAKELTMMTKGLLVGEIATQKSEDNQWRFHNLDVVAPNLNNFRQRILAIKHRANMVYPAFVEAEVFDLRPTNTFGGMSGISPATLKALSVFGGAGTAAEYEKRPNEASSDIELVELLRRALQSNQVKALLSSLIALSNDTPGEDLEVASDTPSPEGETDSDFGSE